MTIRRLFKICKECGQEINSSSTTAINEHIESHGITAEEYCSKYNINTERLKFCQVCKKLLSKSAKKFDLCTKHNKSGEMNPMYGKNIYANKTHEEMIIIREQIGNRTREMWKNEEYRNKVINGVSKPRRKGFAKEQSIRIKQTYIDHPELRKLRGETFSKAWKEGKNTFHNHSVNRSKEENELRKVLKELLPEHIISTESVKCGNHRFLPDILIYNHIIIEFFGDYFHGNPKYHKSDELILKKNKTSKEIWNNDNERKMILESYGYDFLYVWQDDYRNYHDEVISACVNYVINDEMSPLLHKDIHTFE